MNEQLRIDSLSVTNYRCFRRFDEPIRFEPELTVLVARNGEGKTAFLDAVKIALGIGEKERWESSPPRSPWERRRTSNTRTSISGETRQAHCTQ